MDFTNFFRNATGFNPYAYQQRVAHAGLPDLLEIPTGAGKTAAAVLPWLHRRLHGTDDIQKATPRRLVLVLPTRVLTTQTANSVRGWLEELKISESVQVHEMLGGKLDRQRLNEWRVDLHQLTIVIGTMDMVLSRMLMRGYGTGRALAPVDFALLTNDAHIVVDEVQLAAQGTSSLRQISAFQRALKVAAPVGLTVMSATVDDRILDTPDNRYPEGERVVRLEPSDLEGGAGEALKKRVQAKRTVRQLGTSKPKEIAEAAIAEYEAEGGLVAVIVNTVDTATGVYKALKSLPSDRKVLLHSRFRGVEREKQFDTLAGLDLDTTGGVVVSTQAIEAGVDIDARVLITEVAPWPSLIQRIGRCNRRGRYGEATVRWAPALTAVKSGPYRDRQAEMDAAAEVLTALEGESVTSERLAQVGEQMPRHPLGLRLLRRRDFDQLFDTSPDLSGNDIDIRPFIHPDEDLDVQLAWVKNDPVESRRKGHDLPAEGERCPVSISAAKKFFDQSKVLAWTFHPGRGEWTRLTKSSDIRPQNVILVAASSGGYDTELGFTPSSKRVVDTLSDDESHTEQATQAPSSDDSREDPGALGQATWLSLDQHSRETEQQAIGLIEAINPKLAPEARIAIRRAALLHDLGKVHPTWQRAICTSDESDPPESDCPIAKSPGKKRLRLVDDKGHAVRGFRHEVVSALMLSTKAGADFLETLNVDYRLHSLVRYLVASHHGHLRVSPRDQHADGRDGGSLFGLTGVSEVPRVQLDDHELPVQIVDSAWLTGQGGHQWVEGVLDLLDEYGPFALAYMEALVRMADWRASAMMSSAKGQTDGAA